MGRAPGKRITSSGTAVCKIWAPASSAEVTWDRKIGYISAGHIPAQGRKAAVQSHHTGWKKPSAGGGGTAWEPCWVKMPGSERTDLFCRSPPHPDGMRHHFSPVTAFWLLPCLGTGGPAAFPCPGRGLAGWEWVLSGPHPSECSDRAPARRSRGAAHQAAEFVPSTTGCTHQRHAWCQAQPAARHSRGTKALPRHLPCPCLLPVPFARRWGDGLLSLGGIHGRGRAAAQAEAAAG